MTPLRGSPIQAVGKFPAHKNLCACFRSFRATGPWVGGELHLVRFKARAWAFGANGPCAYIAVGAGPRPARLVSP